MKKANHKKLIILLVFIFLVLGLIAFNTYKSVSSGNLGDEIKDVTGGNASTQFKQSTKKEVKNYLAKNGFHGNVDINREYHIGFECGGTDVNIIYSEKVNGKLIKTNYDIMSTCSSAPFYLEDDDKQGLLATVKGIYVKQPELIQQSHQIYNNVNIVSKEVDLFKLEQVEPQPNFNTKAKIRRLDKLARQNRKNGKKAFNGYYDISINDLKNNQLYFQDISINPTTAKKFSYTDILNKANLPDGIYSFNQRAFEITNNVAKKLSDNQIE